MKKKVKIALERTKQKNSLNWTSYKKRLEKIDSMKLSSLLKEKKRKQALSDTKKSISQNYSDYQVKKLNILNISPIPNFKLYKEIPTKNTKIKFYEPKGKIEIDNNDLEIFLKSEFRYLRCIIDYVNQLGVKKTGSKTFTNISVKQLIERGDNIIDLTIEYIEAKESDKVVELLNSYISIVKEKNEKPEQSKKKRKRKTKK